MTKKCCICKIEKEPEEFAKHARSKDGLQTMCRKCATEYSQRPENKRRRSELAAERRLNGLARDQRYRHLFGITLADYYKMFFEQGEVCKICMQPQHTRKSSGEGVVENLCVDHDHKTGRVRGLLCNNCNSFVGFANDNPEWLEKAIAYLKLDESDPRLGRAEKFREYLGENQITTGEPHG